MLTKSLTYLQQQPPGTDNFHLDDPSELSHLAWRDMTALQISFWYY